MAKRRYRPFGKRRPRVQVDIDYKDVATLQKFLSQYGKIHARGRTGLSAKDQRRLKRHIKYARYLGLLPYT